MDPIMLTVGAGMKAQMESLDLLSNNVANAGSTGYKADRDFYRLFSTSLAQPDRPTGEIGWMPLVEGSVIDFRQGPLVETGAPLDVGLSGPGFLVVESTGQPLYTRNGHLTRSVAGLLQASDGRPLLDTQGGRITLPVNGDIEIGPDGLISADGQAVARLGLVEFDSISQLIKAGDSYFTTLGNLEPQPATATSVSQGKLEGSNVNAPQQAVQLILTTQNFVMMQRVASLVGNEMNAQAVEVLGRTG